VLFLTCQQGFAEVDGAQLYYEITESGPPLELLHGFTLDFRMWPPYLPILDQYYQARNYILRTCKSSAYR
jgi:3-oxoadipate enol-lactonase